MDRSKEVAAKAEFATISIKKKHSVQFHCSGAADMPKQRTSYFSLRREVI
jgi:hypothetical protein